MNNYLGNYKYDIYFMKEAIEKAKYGIEHGQPPFGACLVKNDKIIALEHNRVKVAIDITAHAEVTAIRQACLKLKTTNLSGCIMYATCEPCVMCFAACTWANIGVIVYGASVWHASNRRGNELVISNKKLKEVANGFITIISGVMEKECKDLFTLWENRLGNKFY